MSLGLGNRYWVERLHGMDGTLEECLKYISDHKPKDKYEWYEWFPRPDVKKGTCDQYSIALVTMVKKTKK